MTDIFEIKAATVEDIPLILLFIKELAEYEQLLHEVVATEDILRETLFGKQAHAEVIIGYLTILPGTFGKRAKMWSPRMVGARLEPNRYRLL